MLFRSGSVYQRLLDAFLRRVLLLDHKLSTRLLVFSAVLIVFPLLAVGVISYQQSQQVLEQKSRESSWQIIGQVQHYVEDYFRDFEISTLKIVNHPDTIAYLRQETIDAGETSESLRRDVRIVLMDASFSRSDIANVTIVLNDGQKISAQESDYNELYLIEREYWFWSVPYTGEPMLFSRVIPWNNRLEPVITIVKRFVSPQTLEPFGLLLIDVNYRRLEEVTRKVQLGDSGFLFILDERGHYVYHPQSDRIGTPVDEDVLRHMRDEPSGSFVNGEDRKNLLTYSFSPNLNWWIVTSIPYDELTSPINYIGKTILTTVIISLVAAYLLGVGFAASLIRPIRRLMQYMKRVEVGDFSGKVEVKYHDELGLLSHGFNKMVERLSELLNEIYFSRLRETEMSLRQKETELKVLQSQMNPHFFYNFLDTIRGMAMDRDMDDIAQMAASLGKVLRYNLKNSSPVVTLREELDICEQYLSIQKFRFEEKLNYSIDVPEWAKNQYVAKFSLQPIVENCIVHGLEPNHRPTDIRITATMVRKGVMSVIIADTGVGIDSLKLARLRKQMSEDRDITAGGEHLGVLNVHQRNRNLFGDEFGLSVHSEAGKGTEVRLILPCAEDTWETVPSGGGYADELHSSCG